MRLVNAERLTGRNIGIDFLRGFLALWVVVTHLFPWAIYSGQEGFLLSHLNTIWAFFARTLQGFGALNPAVLGFIVLSGYCIHRNGLRSKGDPVKPYAVKRLFRIVPTFLMAGLLGYVFLKALGVDSNYFYLTGGIAPDVQSLLLKFSGLYVFWPANYPAGFQGNAPLDTVMVEIWLYIAYPVLLGLYRRVGDYLFAGILIGIMLCGIFISYRTGLPGWFQNASIYKFLLYWWIGVYFVSIPKNRLHWKTIILCVSAYVVAYNMGWKHVAFVELLHVGLALAFGFIVRGMETWNMSLKALAPMSWVGKSGYSLYAFHAPLVIVMLHFGIAWWAIIALTILISYAIYVVLEKPTTRFGINLSKRLIAKSNPKT